MRAVSPARTALLALFLCLVPTAACNSSGISDEDRLSIYADSAFVHYEQGDLDRAQSQALRGLAIDSEHRPLNLMLGWILLRRDNRDDLLKAEQIFRRQVDETDDDRATLGLGTSLERLGQLHEEAAVAVEEGRVTTDAKSREAGIRELEEEAREHRLEALELFEKVLADRSDNQKALNGAMRVTASLDRTGASLDYADRLLESVRTDVAFWESVLQSEDIDAEEEDAVRKRVTDGEALLVGTHLFAATLLHGDSRTAAALPHLDAVVDLDPTLSEAYSMRAQVLAEAGRLDDAVVDIEAYIARSEKPYEHPDIQHAFNLRSEWTRELTRSGR